MIKKARLSTIEAPKRYGGLLICGLNYGLPRGGSPQGEADFKPWAEHFTHPTNRESDRFVSRLASWFAWWNLPLETPDGTPTELNQAISQTNLFYDSSRSFASRTSEEVERAFARLHATVERLYISGVLLAGVSMADAARTEFTLGEWDVSRAGRFSLRRASTPALRVAVCPHPRTPQSCDDVKGVGKEMREWIASVMREHQKTQSEPGAARYIASLGP